MGTDVETVVVGAGAVGLAIARALCAGGQQVMVLERQRRVGTETSARSSEVIHAGLYYRPGSLKARLCVEGRERLYAFAEANGVVYRRPGKLLVATDEGEVATLRGIGTTAEANGVGDLVWLSGADVKGMEPELAAAGAYLSPSTGVIDSHGLVRALEGHVESLGGEVVLGANVTGLSRAGASDFEVMVETDGAPTAITSRKLVIAAGLDATALGDSLGFGSGYPVPRTYPAKGHYFAVSGRVPFRHLIYPVPSRGSLGIHLTLDTAGQAKFGPDIEWKDDAGYRSYDFEDADGGRRRAFALQIRRYWPGLPDGALVPGHTGIRPKLHRGDEPAADFAIHGAGEHGLEGLVALYGIESPGLTASLAIGSHVARLLGVRDGVS